MIFECKKTENCFADSQTYEYRIPVTAEHFVQMLDENWDTRYNMKLRRPVFITEHNEIRIKGILQGSVIRVSYPDSHWESSKTEFEKLLSSLF